MPIPQFGFPNRRPMPNIKSTNVKKDYHTWVTRFSSACKRAGRPKEQFEMARKETSAKRCPHCGMSFSPLTYLNAHVMAKHTSSMWAYERRLGRELTILQPMTETPPGAQNPENCAA